MIFSNLKQEQARNYILDAFLANRANSYMSSRQLGDRDDKIRERRSG